MSRKLLNDYKTQEGPMKNERKIVFETMVGSHLYGTNRPESDEDFCGIFLPSTADMLGMQNCPSEWSKNEKYSISDRNEAGDVDRKYYSLQKFLKMAAEGQSLQLEMLFAPKKYWTYPQRPLHDEWSHILKNRDLFISKKSLLPFIGFAKAQAHKALIRGSNLNLIRDMILHLKTHHPHENLGHALLDGAVVRLMYDNTRGDTPIKYVTTSGGQRAIEIAGRQYEFTQQIRYVIQKLKRIEKTYGTRSETAADNTYDYKSLMHAYRLIIEAKMLLTLGEIILPLSPQECKFLLSIRNGEYKADFFQEIEEKLTELREFQIKSHLQESVNHGKIEELCQDILYKHLFNGSE